jgi:DNA processing protein
MEAGGRTIAVLGCVVDRVYPAENKQLMEDIIEKGMFISEFPLGTKPEGGNFPQRNRIISVLSHGTIIVEAGHRSGAILTAFNALDQNREVFAVPGRIADGRSKGTNRLIRNGAVLVERTEHVLQAIEPQLTKRIKPRQRSIDLDLSEDEKSIFTLLEHNPIHIDELVDKSEKDLYFNFNHITEPGIKRCRTTAQWETVCPGIIRN